MRLLNVETFQLEYFHNAEDAPPYAILSHAWEEGEVLFEDIFESPRDKEITQLAAKIDELESYIKGLDRETNEPAGTSDQAENKFLRHAKKKKGWSKLEGCCKEAVRFGLEYVWIDTCCIFKGDSAELSEAINSMFAWYEQADICFAFLSDIHVLKSLHRSRWFTRGWTLQELLAPKEVLFYQSSWLPLGSKISLAQSIEIATQVPVSVLKQEEKLNLCGVATKMSWAANRKTTRPEDKAYSLMGLFQVHMPTIYGEGEESALFRLQSEVFTNTGDHSILAWCLDVDETDNNKLDQTLNKELFAHVDSCGLLAVRTWMFKPCNYLRLSADDSLFSLDTMVIEPNEYVPLCPQPYSKKLVKEANYSQAWAYSAATRGIRVQILLERLFEDSDVGFLAHLACTVELRRKSGSVPGLEYTAGIFLKSNHQGVYTRAFPNLIVAIPSDHKPRLGLKFEDVYLIKGSFDVTIKLPMFTDWLSTIQYVHIPNEDFSKVGFGLKECSDLLPLTDRDGTTLRFIQDSYQLEDAVLFEDNPKDASNREGLNFAIRWARSSISAMYIWMYVDIPSSSTIISLPTIPCAVQQWSMSPKLQLFSSKESNHGIRVTLGIRTRNYNDMHMYVSVSRRPVTVF